VLLKGCRVFSSRASLLESLNSASSVRDFSCSSKDLADVTFKFAKVFYLNG